MPITIDEHQMAYIEGRQILDSALIANKVVEEYRARGKEWAVLKIDLAKAYDHVEWNFVDFVMEKKGFGRRWRTWIRGCLWTANFPIIINGRSRGKFRGSRCLRERILYPLFYSICWLTWWVSSLRKPMKNLSSKGLRSAKTKWLSLIFILPTTQSSFLN